MKDKCDRKPVPREPTEGMVLHDINSLSGLSAEELTEIDRLANETYNTVPLGVCLYCGRSFLSEKLIIHNKSCTAGNPGRPVNKAFESRFSEDCVRSAEKAIKPRWGAPQFPIQKLSRSESEGGMIKKKIPTGGRKSAGDRDTLSSQSRAASPQPHSSSMSERSNRDYNTDMRECSTTEQSDSESGTQHYTQTTFDGYDEAEEAEENLKIRKDSSCTDSSMSKNSAPINLPDRVEEMEFTVALMADTINEMKLIVADLHAMKLQEDIVAKKKEKQREKDKNCSIC
jgi:hypothetical protein